MQPAFLQGISRNQDLPFLDKIQSLGIQPIFIMGLHRSGTTFLYETLNQLLPVASLSVYELTFYPRLLRAIHEGTWEQEKAELDAYFRTLGLQTRPTDHVPLSHAALEEYGWLLMRHGGSFYLSAKTLELFREICRKLLFLQSGSQAVLMKSPWDTGRGSEIHRLLPEARFIYLRRDPLEILNSQFKNSLLFGSKGDPFLNLLLTGIPLGKAVIWGQQLLYRLGGNRLYRKILLKHLIRDICQELGRFRQATAELPLQAVFELDYADLMARPQQVLGELVTFLDLPLKAPLESVQPQPRRLELFPEIAARRAELESLFAEV